MGMACDADARGTVGGVVNPSSSAVNGLAGSNASAGLFIVASGAAVKAQAASQPSTVGLNAEETALILASLSKGKFGPVAFAVEDSDLDDNRHSDMEDISGDDDDDDDDDEDGPNGRVQRVQQINFDGPVGSKLDFMDDAGFSHRFRNESNRVKSLVTKHISIDELRAHFDRPIIDVAKDFGICITLMKKICRRNGIKRWPHRQIRSLSKSIASMEAAMLSTHGGERDKYRDQILNLQMKRESVIADPNKENAMRPKTPTKDGSASSSSRGGHPHQHQGPKLSPRTGQPMQHANGPFVASQGGLASVAIKTETGSQSANSTGTGTSSSHSKGGRWTSEEHAAFLEGIRLYGKDWRRVAQVVMTRSAVQTRTHAQKYLLKFAGRFPFDSDGVLKDRQHADEHVDHSQQQHQQQPQYQQQQNGGHDPAVVDTEMASPDNTTASVYQQSHSLLTPMDSEDTVSRASWSSEETPTRHQHPARALEAMAMILNSPDSVSTSPRQSQTAAVTAFTKDDDVPMYSPMGSSSSLGRALPSLAMPAIKSEQPSPSQQFPSSPEQLKSASTSPSQAEELAPLVE